MAAPGSRGEADARTDDGRAPDARRDPAPGRDRLRGARGRDARPRRPAAPDRLRDDRRARAAARGRPRAPGCAPRRPGRDAVHEPPPPPRGLLRGARHGGDPPHAQPAPARRRPRPDRRRRRRPRRSSSTRACCRCSRRCASASTPATAIVAGDGPRAAGALAFEDLLADDPGDAPARARRARRGVPLLHVGHHRARRRASSTRTGRWSLHSLASGQRDVLDVREADTVMPVVPMFHVNAWGLPFTLRDGRRPPGAARAAARRARACSSARGRSASRSRPASRRSGSRCSQALDAEPGAHDVSTPAHRDRRRRGRPAAMIGGFDERHGIHVAARLGHDRDDAARHREPAAAATSPTRPTRSATGVRAGPGPAGAASSRSAPAATTGWCPGTARRWASSRCAARGSPRLLRPGRAARPLHRRRLVPHRRHRHDRRARRACGSRPRQGPRQVRRRVDQLGRARERAHGPPRRGRGRRDRGPRRRVAGAALAVVVLRDGASATPTT